MAASQLDETLTEAQVDAIVAFLGTLTGRYRGNLLTQARP
jgi:cytochrome c peroxidase